MTKINSRVIFVTSAGKTLPEPEKIHTGANRYDDSSRAYITINLNTGEYFLEYEGDE